MNATGENLDIRHSPLRQIAEVIRSELREIFTDGGVMLIMLFAIFIYTSLYGIAYGSEVLRKVPIAVVDMSNTSSSRHLAAKLGEGPSAEVAYVVHDMEEARKLLYERKVYGVVYIPADYERRLVGGEQADVAIYCDASYFLIYREVYEQMVAALTYVGAEVTMHRLVMQEFDQQQALSIAEPVRYHSHTLFNPSLGYGVFVMPAIIVLIIQQTLLMGIGIIGVTQRSGNITLSTVSVEGRGVVSKPSVFELMVGRAITYFMVSATVSSLALTLPYYLFGYPMHGSVWSDVAVMVPYILACTMLGITLSTLFCSREEPILWLLWSSIPALMLSGVSYPSSAMPAPLTALGAMLPSTHAITAFLRVRDMGASLRDILPSLIALWILVVVYTATAALSLARRQKFSGSAKV